MKFLLTSDWHLLWDSPVGRLDNAHETQMEKLKFLLDFAEKEKVVIIQAGDFFHRPRSWYLLPEVMSLLLKGRNPIYCVVGQHDRYMYSENIDSTALGILNKSGCVFLLDGIFMPNDEVEIYGCGWGEQVPEVSPLERIKILVIHAPILMSKVWAEQIGYHYAPEFLNKYKEFDLILCGDIHKKFIFRSEDGRIICNSGLLLRLNASEDMFDHHPGFWIWDSDTFKMDWIEIPHKPAEEVLSREHIDDVEDRSKILSEFIENIKSGGEVKGVVFVDVLEQLCQNEGIGEEVKKILGDIMEKKDG